MQGSDALKIVRAALRLAVAERRRAVARRELRALLEQDDADPEELEDARAAVKSCGAQVAGYRRGLRIVCQPALKAGTDIPRIRNFVKLPEGSKEVL